MSLYLPRSQLVDHNEYLCLLYLCRLILNEYHIIIIQLSIVKLKKKNLLPNVYSFEIYSRAQYLHLYIPTEYWTSGLNNYLLNPI